MRLMSEVMAHTITLHLLDAPGRVRRFDAQAPGARRADPEEGARRLPQPLGRDAVPAEAARQDLSARRGLETADGNRRDLGHRAQLVVDADHARRRPRRRARPPAARRRRATMPRRTTRPASLVDRDVDVAASRSSARSAARARACERQVLRAWRASAVGLGEFRAAARAPRSARTQLATETRSVLSDEVVERRIAPGHAELLAHARGVRAVAAPDLVGGERDVVGARGAPCSQVDAQLERRVTRTQTTCGTARSRQRRAPAADQDDVARRREVEHLLGGEDRRWSSRSARPGARPCRPCPRGCRLMRLVVTCIRPATSSPTSWRT